MLVKKHGARASVLIQLMTKGPAAFQGQKQAQASAARASSVGAASVGVESASIGAASASVGAASAVKSKPPTNVDASMPVKEEKEKKKKRVSKKRKAESDQVPQEDAGVLPTSSSSVQISRKKMRKFHGISQSQPRGPSLIVTEVLENISEPGKILDEIGVSQNSNGDIEIGTVEVSQEVEMSRETMRDAMAPTAKEKKTIRLASSTGKKIMRPVDSSEVGIEANVLNDEKFNRIAEKELRPQKMTISLDATKFLSEGIQTYVKDILERAHKLSKRRRDASAFFFHDNILKTLGPTGEVNAEVQANVGMKWGLDYRKKLLIEAEKKRIDTNKKIEECEAALLKKMQELDAERQLASKRKSAAQDKISLQWWTRDQEMISADKYDINQLAMVQWKNEIAEKYSVGPYLNKKKRVVKRVDGTSGTDPMCDLEYKDLDVPRDGDEYVPSSCPIKYDSKNNIINNDDVYGVLQKLPKPASVNKYNAALETCLLRAKLGLFSPDDPRINIPVGPQYQNFSSGQNDDLEGGDSKKNMVERRGRKPGSLGKKKQSLTNLASSQSASGLSSLTTEPSAPPMPMPASSDSVKPSASMPTFSPVFQE